MIVCKVESERVSEIAELLQLGHQDLLRTCTKLDELPPLFYYPSPALIFRGGAVMMSNDWANHVMPEQQRRLI